MSAREFCRGVQQEQRDLARRVAARRFGDDGAERLALVLADISDPDRIETVAAMVHECETVGELVERAANGA